MHADGVEWYFSGEVRLIMTMRATQKKIMSKPVTNTDDGR